MAPQISFLPKLQVSGDALQIPAIYGILHAFTKDFRRHVRYTVLWGWALKLRLRKSNLLNIRNLVILFFTCFMAEK